MQFNATHAKYNLWLRVNVHVVSLFWLKQDQRHMKSNLLGSKTTVKHIQKCIDPKRL